MSSRAEITEMTTEQAMLIDRKERAPETLSEEHEMYQENIIDHYKNPCNKQALPSCSVCHSNVNPLCGDQITIYANIHEGLVTHITFTGQGCAISQAAASILTETFQGRTVPDLQSFTSDDMLKLLGIPISTVRRKCALLAFATLQQGIASWHSK